MSGFETRTSRKRLPRHALVATRTIIQRRGTRGLLPHISSAIFDAGDARHALNSFDWNNYRLSRKRTAMAAIAKVLKDGSMPPWDYALPHPSAGLNHARRQLIMRWAASAAVSEKIAQIQSKPRTAPSIPTPSNRAPSPNVTSAGNSARSGAKPRIIRSL